MGDDNDDEYVNLTSRISTANWSSVSLAIAHSLELVFFSARFFEL